MNPFYDISDHTSLPDDAKQLRNLGCYQTTLSVGYMKRDGWGGQTYQNHKFETATKEEDYDRQFVHKLLKSRPIYTMVNVLEHHFEYYCSKHPEGKEDFMKHMRYVALPELKRKDNRNTQACVELFEKWLDEKSNFSSQVNPYTVTNNTINISNINAPAQIQQNVDHANQTQSNQLQKEVLQEFFELLRKDIQNMDEQIRKDFGMEMDYAIAQLKKGKDIKPQLSSLGEMIKEIGVGGFSSLVGSITFESLKPWLGLS